jgi:hypothetical protein
MFQKKPATEDYYFEGGLVKKLDSIDDVDFNFNKPDLSHGKIDLAN